MNKKEILEEIRRLAKAARGVAPGKRAFEAETGIRESDWLGRHWVRWNEAITEAGCTPNQKRVAYSETFLIEQVVALIRELGHFPVRAEFRMKARSDTAFPEASIVRRFGSKRQLLAKVLEFCTTNEVFADVLAMCPMSAGQETESEPGSLRERELGFVYLIKHGARREYKIGRTNNTLRREGEIGVELPEKIKPIHVIQTDDPAGVEAYWHQRFADKRLRNEWFELTTDDVKAFKRWRRIS